MKLFFYSFGLLFSLIGQANSVVGEVYSSKTALIKSLEVAEECAPEDLRFSPFRFKATTAKSALVQCRETCGRGICSTYLVLETQGKFKILGHFGSAPTLLNTSSQGFDDLSVLQHSGHPGLFESIKLHYKFNGHSYEQTK